MVEKVENQKFTFGIFRLLLCGIKPKMSEFLDYKNIFSCNSTFNPALRNRRSTSQFPKETAGSFLAPAVT